MSAGEVHPYEVRLTKGQFLRALFDQHGIDVVIDVIAPGGEKIATIDGPTGTEGPEVVELEAPSAGVYRFVVHPLNAEAKPGKYQAKLQVILDPDQYASLLAAEKAKRVGPPPEGWGTPTGASKDCQLTTDTETAHGGHSSARLTCTGLDGRGFEVYRSFENLIQSIRADDYRGRRIRFSAWIKSKDVEDWSKLWMRVDGAGETLTFDRMDNNPVKGSGDWQKREIVLDVPQEAMMITFGLMLNGKGKVWADDFQIETVSPDVQSTNMADEVARWKAQIPWTPEIRESSAKAYEKRPSQPTNLTFEK